MTQIFTGRSALTACALLATLMLRPAAWAEAAKSLTPAEDADQHVVMAEKTFQDFVADPGQDYFRKLLAKAQGVLIIPASARVAFIFGGQGGRGVLVARDQAGKWIGPAFYTLSYASVGLQIGVQVSEVIVLVMTQSAISSLLSSAVRGGVDAALAAGPVGTGTQTSFQGDFISVYRSKVLYGGLNLDGTVLSANDAWNTGFYGKPTTAVDILVRREASSSKGEGLLNAVSDAAAQAARAAPSRRRRRSEQRAVRMPVATLENVSLAYGHVPLLDHVGLSLDAGEKVALIGRNGTGKSSLLRLLAGTAAPDDGQVWRQPGLRVSWVAQEPQLGAGQSVFEVAADGLGEVRSLLADYEAAAHAVEAGDTSALGNLERLSTQLDATDGWRLKSRVDGVLTRLGLAAQSPVSALSGGQRKRLALARALVAEPELLLLDEPTNHLDVVSIEWLEELLAGFTGALLFVTHDRVFLDRVADRIVELDRGRLTNFPGNFAAYRSRKEQQLAEESTQQEKFDRVLAQEEAWIRRGVEARRTRDEGRVRRLEQLRRERAARRDRLGSVGLAVEEGERSGKLVAELTHVVKAFDRKTVVQDFSCRILRGDKIGLIGPNAAGKTTLIRLILGDLAPDAGRVRLGTKLAIAYFDQFRAQLDEEASVFETVGEGSDYIEVAGTRKHVMSYLGEFLFPPERVRSPVKSLSGGERNRLLLARLFAKSANVLVLDEPTNDLDLESLELLEGLLQEYTGTVLLVSHDRAFLDNVVTQVIAYDGDGRWVENPGGYQEWARVLSARASRATVARQPEAAKRAEPQRTARQPRLSYKEAQELEQLPARIEALEREQADLTRRLADPDLYRSDPESVKTAGARHAEVEALLLQLLGRWEALEDKQGRASSPAQ